MKIQESKKQLFVLYMTGFLAGILYANIVSKQYVSVTGIFNEYFLNQYAQTEVVAEEYIWYIIQVRLLPFAVLAILGCTRFKKPAVLLCLLWTGFSTGMLAVASVMHLGLKGILLCVAGMLPHFIFYILAYTVLLWYFYNYPNTRWNPSKTLFVAVTFAIGIILESYINPVVLKAFINTMS